MTFFKIVEEELNANISALEKELTGLNATLAQNPALAQGDLGKKSANLTAYLQNVKAELANKEKIDKENAQKVQQQQTAAAKIQEQQNTTAQATPGIRQTLKTPAQPTTSTTAPAQPPTVKS